MKKPSGEAGFNINPTRLDERRELVK